MVQCRNILPAHTNKNARTIRTFIEAVFEPKRKSARLQPRVNIEYDMFEYVAHILHVV